MEKRQAKNYSTKQTKQRLEKNVQRVQKRRNANEGNRRRKVDNEWMEKVAKYDKTAEMVNRTPSKL